MGGARTVNDGSRRVSGALIGLAGLVLPLFATIGCQTTPEEIRNIQLENELLREQIQIIKENCAYYRDLEIDLEQKPSDD
jgi:hypothetical protein